MAERNSMITAKQLEIGYQGQIVGSTVDFELEQGGLCAIIGANGIGKSTLLRTMASLQPRLKGELFLNGKKLEEFTQNELAKQLSVVLTESLATKNLSVEELITLGRQPFTNWLGKLAEDDLKAITESLTTLHLDNLKDKKCFELSDGQLQRTLIARAVAQDTPLILLDEPTTHLDLHHKVQILKLLKTLVSVHNKTIVFTSHEIELALQLCDYILILNGKENPFGKPNELIEGKHLEQLFPSDFVQFDKKSATFRLSE